MMLLNNLIRLRPWTVLVALVCWGCAASQPRTQDTRSAFLAMIDRPRVGLAAEEISLGVDGGLAKFHFVYSSEAGQRVPGLLLVKQQLLKDGHRHPAVVVLHGTAGRKEAEMDTLKDLALRGFVAVAIDARFHGERGNQADYNAAIAQAFADRKSHPLYYDEVWDQMRLLDYLQARPEIDPKRIGMMGISKGGIESWLTAAVDPRVSVAVPCISVQCFKWGLENDGWHGRIGTVQKGFDAAAKSAGIDKPGAAFVQEFYDHLIPGIYARFDCPQMLPLISPRPMLVVSGEKDPINPIKGMQIAEAAAKRAYATAGAADKFEVLLETGVGHKVTSESHLKAMEWFEEWLRPAD